MDPSLTGISITTTGSSIVPEEIEKKYFALVALHCPNELDAPIHALPLKETGIGRTAHPRTQFVIPDHRVSGRHAVLRHEPKSGRHLISDQNSKNGTMVNGRRIGGSTLLKAGDILRLGDTLLLYEHWQQNPPGDRPAESEVIGQSPAFNLVFKEALRVADKEMNIIITGESGTGKEVLTKEIHRLSRRKGRMVAINCGALPDNLMESELFGYVRGAFSGAVHDKEGLFQAASGGTLLLDEITELSLKLQAKLLRAVETGEVLPLGTTTPQPVRTRIISATNRDMEEELKEGRFRGDLYMRLNDWSLNLPPLRERKSDILPLARAFLSEFNPEKTFFLDADFVEAILLFDWPYNIRELKKEMRRAAVLGEDEIRLALSHLPEKIGAPISMRRSQTALMKNVLPSLENRCTPPREELVELLSRFKGKVSRIAKELNLDRAKIYRWIKKYDIDLDVFK